MTIDERQRNEAELSRLLKMSGSDDIPRVEGDRGPMSSGQRQMWFFEQWSRGTPTYHTPAVFWADGPLDPSVLGTAYAALVRRHGALRTRFADGDGRRLDQFVDPAVPAEYAFHDVSGRADAADAARRLVEAAVRRPFDLRQGPPARLTLIRVDPRRHLLALTVHHMVGDGVSLGVLLRDLDVLYREADGESAVPPPEPGRYLDFAAFEHDRLSGGGLDEELAYWRDRLAGAPEILPVPTSGPRPSTRRFAGRTVTFLVPDEVAARVRDLSGSVGVTPFTGYLTAFQILLTRFTGETDLVVGTPVSLRDRPGLAHVVGPLVNTVPIRTDLSGRPDLAEALRRTHAAAAAAYAHKDLPFERMVTELAPQRSLSHSPIVQVVFGAQERPGVGASIGAARLSGETVERGTAKFDLTWSVFLGEHTSFEVEYDSDLFDATDIDRLIAAYGHLLTSATDPARSIGDLDLLDPQERAAVLRRSAAARPTVATEALTELFARSVDARPDAIAVSDTHRQLSYADLDQRSTALAHALRQHGAGPGSIVGLCVDRSVDLVVALLAVLKSGAAYLPLDVRYPRDRLGYMLDDAGTHAVVADKAGRAALPEGPWPVVDVAHNAPLARPLEVTVSVQDRAYVLYTSGTTGRPKAVEVTHGNVSRLLSSTQHWFGFRDTDVWTMFHSHSFDFSVWEMWGALAYGGRLVVVPYLVARSPGDFHELVRAEGVTVLNQTPSAFRQFEAADADSGARLALRLVVFGGEAVDLGSVGRWFDRRGDESPRLVNMYGITETTVHVTYRPLRRRDVASTGSPLGVPIPDLSVYLLDRFGGLLPDGVPGEFYVGGGGVAKGYLGHPELTAERFVADPFSDVDGARLYRTGDVGRRRADGELEYLGRNDDQVKIRGFRIEIGEIDNVLSRIAGVRAAATTVRRDGGAPRLVAYVVGPGLTVGTLRTEAAKVLPEHMIPAVFVFLDALPTTPNGKVDHQRLPAPQATRPDLAGQYEAPRDGVERIIAEAWAEVLEVDRVGVHDSFFDLGGDSIRTLQAIGTVKKRGLEIMLPDLFRTPTVAELAPLAKPVDATDRRREPFSLVSEQDRAALPKGLEDAYPMSVLQAGMVYHMTLDTENLPYHNVNVFRVGAPFHEAAFRQAVADTVTRHSIMRTAFDLSTYSEPMQLVYPTADLPVEVEDLRGMSAAEQEEYLLGVLDRERRSTFSPGDVPLLRYLVHRRSDREFQWTITEHHAVFDGWSLFSTQAETLRRYLQLLRDPQAPADPPPVAQFRDFIELEREAIESPEHRGYWAGKLDGYRPFQLPRWGNGPRGPKPGADYDTPTGGEVIDGVRRWRFTSTGDASHRSTDTLIPPELCEAVLAAAAQAGVPLKTVLLSAYLKVLSLLTGERDVVAGVSTHGRPEDVDSTEVRGMFLNIPPVMVTVSGGTWLDLIQRTFAAEQEMLPYRRYPYAHMQWDVGTRSRLFDTSFLYNHFHVMSDVLGAGVEIMDGRVENQAEYRVEPNSFSVNAGVLRNPRSNQMLWRVDYYTDRVSDEMGEAMHRYYVAVLRAMATPTDSQEGFSPLGAVEHDRLVYDWNGSREPICGDLCLHDVVALQAGRTPQATAVSDGGPGLSYADLHERVTRLARHLRRLGAGPGSRVAVAVPPGAELMVALLAVSRIGATSLPYAAPPVDGDMLGRIDLAVTTEADAGRFGTGPTVALDRDAAAIAAATGSLSDPAVDPATAVCVVDGQPMSHRALVAYLAWAAEEYGGRTCGGGVPLTAVPASAAGFAHAFLPLVLGEHVRVLPADVDLRQQAPFGVLPLAPAQLAELSATGDRHAAAKLAGTIVIHGDPFPERVLDAWRELAPDSVVVHEFHAFGGVCAGEGGDGGWSVRVPVGRPLPGMTAYVLGADGRITPPGVTGVLHFGGVEVAGEPSVSGPIDGERLRPTGRYARWLPDGRLDVLDPETIAGRPVDVTAVASVLAGLDGVGDAVVAVEDSALVAYVVGEPPYPADEVDAVLPAGLEISAYRRLDRIPLGGDGRIDRAALASHACEALADRGEGAAASPLETEIAALWSDLLHTPIDDMTVDFFEVGGQSLKAAQLRDRIGARYAVEVPLITFFRARTVRDQAVVVIEAVSVQRGVR
ncbi:non-ribosomal peptide synthetase [Micromonospora inyonensis]|uniref:Amino acid adenylation domain-containing protein n=1 Tax=Micromonospora inyonensis TaxID=47866 RepID=A0A1C6S7A0_9ACTN|nr:non-ribosomal peptide synthetase [Micromonospora inyonensis]SCL25323.1 amino acid adenylation domain-containing protein [Micromonospora inyonensis]